MNWFQKAASYMVRKLSVSSSDGWYSSGDAPSFSQPISERVALSLSAVWACTNLVSGSISALPFRVMKVDGEGSKAPAPEHSLHRVIHNSPNYDQTALDFWDFVTASIDLKGNSYARIIRARGKIVALDPILAFVSVRRTEKGALEYSWSDDGKSFKEMDVDIFHIRGPGGNPLGGRGVLTAARDTIRSSKATENAAAGMFNNGLRPSGVLTFEKWLTKEQRTLAEKKLTGNYVGAMNSGKPMILEGGTKWEQITLSPEDAQMLETRGFSVEEICRFFGVPPFMIGHTSKSTSWGKGLEQQVLGFLKFSLRRRIKRIEQAADQQLLTAKDRANGYSVEINIDALLRADSSGRASFYKEMTSMGAMTINEVRKLEGLPAVAGGDVPRMQSQNVPITSESKPNAIGVE